ncbi:MAG: MBOAT family protein [Bacteroidia bacterium]|nr:MBOAT family protein [Bacteroidia bacterium]MCC7532448.1 MBOAT family protein [Bacteroidia bacterium]
MRLFIFLSLSILLYFKYFNFFIESAISLLNSFGLETNQHTLEIILPVGISFYTFHGISYIMDIYYRRINPHNDIVAYSLFVAYFPLLVAGPIERASHLLPQLDIKRNFNLEVIKPALSLMFWGFFKKLVIADSAGMIVDDVFSNYQNFSSYSLIFGSILFTFQIYADFSGYSDIARGVSKLFGIELLLNFNFPYFAKNMQDFWSRWHISLSSFLNDYVFIPIALKFRDFGKRGIYIAVFFTFLISGIWHGAGWAFIFWGILHAIFYLPQFIFSNKKLKSLVVKTNTSTYGFNDFVNSTEVFLLVTLALIFFRLPGISDGFNFILEITKNWDRFSLNEIARTTTHIIVLTKSILGILIVFILEFILFKNNLQIENLLTKIWHYLCIAFLIFLLGSFENATQFIYFQF